MSEGRNSLASVDRKQQVNQYRWRVFGSDPQRLIAFVCECGNLECYRTVVLTSREYTGHRPALLVHNDHDGQDDMRGIRRDRATRRFV